MLTDKYSRKIDYLRISLTDKCNLRCQYCMPPEGAKLLSHDEVLRNEEFIHFIHIFAGLGIKKIRFTGGEPFLRKGFIDILKETRGSFPYLDLGITTNGILLDRALDDLCSMEIKKLNISLDAVSPGAYKKITGGDFFSKVVANIDAALGYNFFDIKINAVLSKDTLDNLDAILDFFSKREVVLRFIERMPFSVRDNTADSVLYDGLIRALGERGVLARNEGMDTRVALMFDFFYHDKYRIKLGVIPPMTQNICRKCNRLRLTCDGFLRTCLHSSREYDIKTPHRMDMGDDAIRDIILKAVSEKPERHRLDCAGHDDGGCSSLEFKRGMYRIGG